MSEAQLRLIDLLTERAVAGLDADRAAELESLLDAYPEWNNDSFDMAAAAIELAIAPEPAPMPAHLRERLLASAAEVVPVERPADRESHGSQPPAPEAPARSSGEADVLSFAPRRDSTDAASSAARSSSLSAWGGWLAAAAALVIAVIGWWPSSAPPADPVVIATAAQEREAFVAAGADLVRVDWTATDDETATGASGDVVWSTAEQRGYMRFAGLATNDPGTYQYQLWVFDAERDERYPVDGGVFDIPAGADEVVVPIDARLPVANATLFAITIEPPGGVVVSTRERIALVASVGP